MSIFGKIKDAIFGKARAATPASPTPAPQPTVDTTQSPGAATPNTQATAEPAPLIDVENHLDAMPGADRLNWRTSIVDLMKLLDIDSSLSNRKELATELGYTGQLDGSAEMNIWLHRAVMRALEQSGGIVPDSLRG